MSDSPWELQVTGFGKLCRPDLSSLGQEAPLHHKRGPPGQSNANPEGQLIRSKPCRSHGGSSRPRATEVGITGLRVGTKQQSLKIAGLLCSAGESGSGGGWGAAVERGGWGKSTAPPQAHENCLYAAGRSSGPETAPSHLLRLICSSTCY